MTKKRRGDPETRRLIDELLTQAGMIMEDASVAALVRNSVAGRLHNRIGELEKSAAAVASILGAARALLDG